MDDLILWFDWLFRELLAGTTINLLNVIQFLLIFILFLIATRFLRRLLRPFIARLEIDKHAQEAYSLACLPHCACLWAGFWAGFWQW